MLRTTLPLAAVALALATLAHAATPEPQANLRYQLGLLSRGPTWTAEKSAHTDSIQAGHMANIGRMAAAGALVAAGPFEDGGDLSGLFVFAPDADSLAGQLAGDPAIASGRLECRLFTWVAPPGLGEEYRQRKRENPGARDSMVTFGWVMIRRGAKYDSRRRRPSRSSSASTSTTRRSCARAAGSSTRARSRARATCAACWSCRATAPRSHAP